MEHLLNNTIFFLQGGNFMLILTLCIRFLSGTHERLKVVMSILCGLGAVLCLKDLFTLSTDRDAFWMAMMATVNMLSVPAFVLMIKEVVNPGSVTPANVVANFAPFLVFIIVFALVPDHKVYICTAIFSLCYGIGAMIYMGNHIMKNRAREEEEPRRPGEPRLSNYQITVCALSLFFLFVWILDCIVLQQFSSILFYITSIVIYSLISYVIERRLLPSDLRTPAQREKDDAALAPIILRLFDIEKIYLNPKLKMSDVAELAGTNRTYLSNFINRYHYVSYPEFVNRYRSHYAAYLLMTSDYSVDEIWRKSGFTSQSTFRRSFSHRYGCTPLEYQQREKISR